MSVQHFHNWAPSCNQPADKDAEYDSPDKPHTGHLSITAAQE